MKDKFDIVSGDFEGNFYTHQKAVLSASESTIDKKHDIHLYRGELRNIKNENEYNPEQLRNRESYLLHNVTNVQFHLEKDATGNNNRIYNFEQILLRDAVIKESWELNGKTYGIITGKLLGKVKDEVKPPYPPPPPPPTPPPPPPFGGCLNIGNGCMPASGCLPAVTGCLSNIWRLLLALLLLLFIIWFLKGCWDKKEESQNCCNERDSLAIENTKLQNEIDSLKRMNDNSNDSIKKENIQEELDELSSKVYFYGGTVKIRKFSDEQLNKIVQILKKYNNVEVEVRGYYNGSGSPKYIEEYNANIDVARANHIKNLLIEKGVDENLVSAVGMGESTLDKSDEDLMQKIEIDGEQFTWNRNMRVEIKIIKY